MWTGRSTKAGFSLVEVMVTVGIFSMLAVLAIPRMGLIVQRSQGEQVAKAVSALISSTQAKARSQEKRYAVLLTAPSGRTPGNAAVAVDVGGTWARTGEQVSLPPGTTVNPPSASVIFNEKGLLDGGSSSLIKIGKRTLTITRWGEVNLQ